MIAKLMLEPADVLFLDEPTNDLDIPTLEVIEESLLEFTGAVVLISHDRCLMDRVCTQILGLGQGNEAQYFADYSQWEMASAKTNPKVESAPKPTKGASVTSPTKKLTYKEQKELDGMEQAILAAELEIESLQKQTDQQTVQTDSKKALEIYNLQADAEHRLETLFKRWQIHLNKLD